MKKLMIVGLLIVAMGMPALASAAVEAAAGNVNLHGHIDYVYRYSQADEDEGWNGYDTQNLEFAVLGMSGQVGDNVSWIISYAFAFAGPYGATMSESRVDANGNLMNDDSVGMLLDARINLNLMDSVQLSFGRFIPPTSMTWSPHQMDNLHTINYPLIHGSGVKGAAMNLPLPMYQTGMMLTAMMGPAQVMIGGFNGSQTVAGDAVAGLSVGGLNNTMDIDRNKGILAKIAVDSEGMHFGGWYYAEDANVTPAHVGIAGNDRLDGNLAQWGIEAAYTANNLLLAAEYLSTTLDAEDSGIDENLVQNGWYIMAGYTMSQVQFVVRYDDVNYDVDETADEIGGIGLANDDYNQEQATTIGLNYFLNEQTTVALNYTMRNPEVDDDVAACVVGEDANTDEIALMIELDLF